MECTQGSRLDRMKLHRIELFGQHGVCEAERKLGQRWLIDLDLQMDLQQAGKTDKLEHSVNYTDLYDTVKKVVEGKSYQLVEALTERIAEVLLERYCLISEATVRVTKPHPPFDIHFQGVTIEMTRVRVEPYDRGRNLAHMELRACPTKQETKSPHSNPSARLLGNNIVTDSHTQIAYITLGTNMGEREQALQQALSALQKHEQIYITRCSSIYETDPIGYEAQPTFLNMAARLYTSLRADELLRAMLTIEKQMGRIRHIRWGPRVIDLDLLWMGNKRWSTAELTLPHPRMGERGFVLVPLAEIISKVDVELQAFVHHALQALNGKEGIRKWRPCMWQSESELSASSED